MSLPKRSISTTIRLRSLSIDNINPNVVAAQYAVRGELAQKSEDYRARLRAGDKTLPFDEVISANIGNPQQLDQKPITFFRQVLSLIEYPKLLENEDVLVNQLGYKTDAIKRARWLLKEIGSCGAYSASAGALGIRESIAKFIERMLSRLASLSGSRLTGSRLMERSSPGMAGQTLRLRLTFPRT
jgi:alanine transaminase